MPESESEQREAQVNLTEATKDPNQVSEEPNASYTQEGKPRSMCNTRFIKGHKPSNHICARIKSHVYTTEWTTYHVKRYNKASTNVIYYINDKMSDTEYAEA